MIFSFFFFCFLVALGWCVLFLFSIVNIRNVKFLILSIFKCTVQSVKSFIGILMQQSQNSSFCKVESLYPLFVCFCFSIFLRYFLVIIFNHFKFQVFLVLIPKMFFSQLPFPYYFILLLFYIFIYLTDLDLNCSIWDAVPWLGDEPGPWLGNEIGSHQTTGKVPVLVLFDRSIFYLSEDIVCFMDRNIFSLRIL